MTLKWGQGHDTLNDNVNPKRDYAKFERSALMVSGKKGNIKPFSSEETFQLSPLNMHTS